MWQPACLLINLYMFRIIGYKFTTLHKDIVIIGGGSAGLAFAVEGAKLGLDMAVFDYVPPSPQGTKWGLGGTCVNVGCIPKKLMHMSALIRDQNESANLYGWQKAEQHTVNWEELSKNVQDYIKGLNYGYKTNLHKLNVQYFNDLATFLDPETIAYGNLEEVDSAIQTKKLQNLKKLKFKYAVVCTGGRPTLLPGISEYAITSDDIFWKKTPPGKTLVVGGGYIALETAGFVDGMGFDVSMMTRGKYLRGFDQQIAEELQHFFSTHTKVKIVPQSLPYDVKKTDGGKLHVKWRSSQNPNQQGEDEFDTLLMAVGRTANTSKLGLERVGVQVNPSNLKILGHKRGEIEATENERIYAIGDVLDGVPELTPVAAKSGQLLARRLDLLLKGNYTPQKYAQTLMDYNDYPTTVFTPLEYSCVGMSEEQAVKAIGMDNIEVYHSKFVPLEEQLCDKLNEDFEPLQKKVYCKVICDKSKEYKVLGMHYLGPNAGEVMQGYAVSMKLGLNFEALQRTVGIHPTASEEFVSLKVTKASGEDFEKHGC